MNQPNKRATDTDSPRRSADIPDMAGGVDAIVKLAQEAAAISISTLPTDGLGEGLPPSVPLLVDPRKGVSTLASMIEQYRLRPERRKGTALVTTLASFIELCNRHKDEHSVIFAKTDWPGPKLTCVIDYHQADGKPRWNDHRVEYKFPVTEELAAWLKGNGQAMGQAEFAAFLEDHAAELASPFDGERSDFERLFKERFATPNELIDLSRNLELFVGAKVKRGERLSSGERTVEFVEEHTNAKGERVEIPGIFMVSVPAWLDGDHARIVARLRYRIKAGEIVWFYQLYRWEAALRERIQQDLASAGKETGLPTYDGAPEQ